MICPHCGSTEGHYYEYEDYDEDFCLWPYTSYYCYGCNEVTGQHSDGFVWEDEVL